MVRILQARAIRRRLLALLTVALAVGATAAVMGTTASAASNKPIMVAGVAPFSGGFATSSMGNENSWNVEIAAIDKAGGIDHHMVKMVVKDDMGQPNLALDDVRAYLAQGIHIFWLEEYSDVVAVKSLMSGDNIIIFTENPVADENNPKEYPYDFNFFPPDVYGVDATVRDAKAKHYTKWAVVSDTTGEFQDYVTFLNADAAGAGAKFVFSTTYDPNATTDFSPMISQIQSSGADAIFFYGVGTPVQDFFTALEASGLNVPIYGGYGDFAANFSGFPNSFLAVAHFPITSTTLLNSSGKPLIPAYGKVAQEFYAKYGKGPFAGGGVSLDMAKAAMWALQQTGGVPDPAKMKAALEKTAAMGGLALTSPLVKYKFSPTNHGGFPVNQVQLATVILNPTWPGFLPKAQ